MSTPNIVPPLGLTRISRALRDYCVKWYGDYAAAYERDQGVAPHWFVKPDKWETMSEYKQWQDNELPHVVIVCAGLMEEPMIHGDGQMDGCFLVTFVLLCGNNDRASSQELAEGYSDILAWLGQDAGNETDFVREIRLVDLDLTTVEPNTSVASAAISFEVDVAGYMYRFKGPPPIVGDPTEDPYVPPEDLPVVVETDLEIDKVQEIPE